MAIKKILFVLCAFTFILLALLGYNWFVKRSGCEIVGERSAAALVKDKLSISGDVSAKVLKGGYGGSKIFLVADGQEKYVVRVLKKDMLQRHKEKEIYNLKVAESGGYGPKIYFADPVSGAIIMEFLPRQEISLEQYQSEDLYVALANVLKKIHSGPKFDSTTNVFDRIKNNIEKIKSCDSSHNNYSIPFAKIENLVATIDKIVFPHAIFTPCHNDLNPNNLIFLGNEFKVIDYETVAQFDPYFDVATIAAFSCLDNPIYEKILFTSYLGRKPSAQEQAHLYLMKQLCWITIAFELLRMVPEQISKYGSLQVPAYLDFMQLMYEGKVSLENNENKIKFAKVMINLAIANSDSQEFKNAVNLLK